jgi:organic hydroperoxide reductase OsmC/OhrA
MLTFLALAAKKQYVVDSYRDQAVGVLGRDPSGNWAMTQVTLRPEVRFGGARAPSAEELRQLHQRAHHDCFIANSVKTEVVVEPQ